MKIGMVSPYAWDVPGGVQAHIRDLANHFVKLGNTVSILAPVVDESDLTDPLVVSAGKPVSIPYNGAVARVLFGPVAASRVRQWISNGEFDVLHLHEPAIPSLSLLACSIAEGPMVGTFHAAAPRQKVAFAIAPLLEPVIEKLRARIAVSEIARETLTIHLDTDAVVIPNGIDVASFRLARPRAEWRAPFTIGFIGRFNEPRKGLNILLEAIPNIVRMIPEARVFIAGPGEALEIMQDVHPNIRTRLKFLGRLSDSEKAEFFKSIDVYVAPNTGGESFGIILAEAMAAGTPVVASNLPAFIRVLDSGKFGDLFENGNSEDLSRVIIRIGKDEEYRRSRGEAAAIGADRFDWSVIGPEVMNVYLHAIGIGEKVVVGSEQRSWLRIFNREERS
jgi:phosphatidylinositol alpha-mannosyltransferase